MADPQEVEGQRESSGTPNNNNEESLGEIWFDRMRHNRAQGMFSRSTSTPSSPTNSSEQEQEERQDTETAQAPPFESSGPSYLDAQKLLDLHKQAQVEETNLKLKHKIVTHDHHHESAKKARLRDCSHDTPVHQRLIRNAREKQRSGKITDQFNNLKDILSQAGVVVPKGTKGTILNIAHAFIVNMKQQQHQREIDNAELHRQIQAIANGSLGRPASKALLMAAKNNGLDCGVVQPPTFFDPLTLVQEQDYHQVWDSCPVGIAITTMGGTFLDCNLVFRTLLNYSKEHLRTLSIFHLLPASPNAQGGKSNLQLAFAKISQLLETIQHPNSSNNSIVLPGTVQGHHHLSLGVSLIHSTKHSHHLCVTLLQPGTDLGNGKFRPYRMAMIQKPPPQNAPTVLVTSTGTAYASSSLSSSSLGSTASHRNDDIQKQQQQEEEEQHQQKQGPSESSQYFTVG